MKLCENLDQYMDSYGGSLGKNASENLAPLHTPKTDPLMEMDLERVPLEAQAHVITAGVRHLMRRKTLIVSGECGTGKTLMGMAVAHMHASDAPYRALVFCPPHLVTKWVRELEMTIPYADVKVLRHFTELAPRKRWDKPDGAEWYVISNNTAKMGPKWKPAYVLRKKPVGVPHCPRCGEMIVVENKKEKRMVPVHVKDLAKTKHACPNCSEPLWQFDNGAKKWPVASYVNRRLKSYFDYLIVDEVHQEKGDNTAQANAMGCLASSCKKIIALTGTLIGGYADHLRTLLFRLSAPTLTADGLTWRNSMEFNSRYGRIETTIHTKNVESEGADNRQSKGQTKQARRNVRPGVMPSLFGKHLLDKCVFLSLDEVAEDLPELHEEVISVGMDEEQEAAYRDVERSLTEAIREMTQRGDKRLLGTMLRTLLGFTDYPYDWGTIGYYEKTQDGAAETFVPVCTPRNLDRNKVRPKEQALIDKVAEEKEQGRQCWVFCNMTDKRDVVARLETLFKNNGFNVKVLRSSTQTGVREEWIADNGPDADVVISHPGLVETGLDLFCKNGTFNFVTLIFYQTGYGLFTLRQASRRSWRIGQKLPCRVFYMYYGNTMQARAMTLMGKKIVAAHAIEGKFSAEGLAAMGGEEGSMEVALAKSLVEKLDDLDASREWKKVSSFKIGTGEHSQSVPMPPRNTTAMPMGIRQIGLFS